MVSVEEAKRVRSLVLASLYLGRPALPRPGWRAIRDLLRRAVPPLEAAEPTLRAAGYLDAAAILATPWRLATFEESSLPYLTAEDDAYPHSWEALLGDAAPPALWASAWANLPFGPMLGVAGSRHPSDASLTLLQAGLDAALDAGIQGVVSGGAAGVDQAAIAFAVGRPRVEVLARGLSPQEIQPGPVLQLSTRTHGEAFSIPAAMERNRLIYLAGAATLVVQPRLGTGGTWRGALDALRLRQQRSVPPVLIALSDPPTPAERALLQTGAFPATPETWARLGQLHLQTALL